MKHRVISIGDRRAAQRMIDVVNVALLDADIRLTEAQRKRLWAELVRQVAENGYALTKQVTDR